MSLSRVFLYSSALTFVANYAVAKYCVKLPTCEELGYIYSADKYPNNRSIKCPFDTKKILLLDYCQAYGLTSCDSTSGECDECIVEKADGTKSNSGYWRYTRCNAGYSYKSGECPPTEVDTSKYPFTQGELNEEIGEIECVQSAQNVYCGYKSCNEGWDPNGGNCIVHDCGSAYPYTSCDTNGTCAECKSGTNTKYGEVTCNSGYIKINNECISACSTPGTCEAGDVYTYNDTPIGVVFYVDNNVTKIVALTDINSTGASGSVRMYWANNWGDDWSAGATQSSEDIIAYNDMNGKYNTSKILSYISANSKTAMAATATSLYAPSVCGTGSMCAKGNWYLPAAGELWTLYSNKATLNSKFTSNSGAAFQERYHYGSSTESPGGKAWFLGFSNGDRLCHLKSSPIYVRPVLQIITNKGLNDDEEEDDNGASQTCALTSPNPPTGCATTTSHCVRDGSLYYSDTCETCQSGFEKIDGKCVRTCTTPGACEVGDVYTHNDTPIGIVFANEDGVSSKLVALTDIDKTGASGSSTMLWANSSDYSWSTGATQSSDMETAFYDMNGKYNTSKILSYISANSKTAEAATATSLYAPSVCGTGSICAKGKWYLPAAGELLTLYSNKTTFNSTFTSNGGAAFTENCYWSSTEYNSIMAWFILFDMGHILGSDRDISYYYVRPVLALCAEGYINANGTCV